MSAKRRGRRRERNDEKKEDRDTWREKERR